MPRSAVSAIETARVHVLVGHSRPFRNNAQEYGCLPTSRTKQRSASAATVAPAIGSAAAGGIEVGASTASASSGTASLEKSAIARPTAAQPSLVSVRQTRTGENSLRAVALTVG